MPFLQNSGSSDCYFGGVAGQLPDRKEAEALEAKWKLEAYRAKHWDATPDISFDEILLTYLKAKAGTRSERNHKLHGRRLREWFANAVMNTLPASTISGYINGRREAKVSNATINRELAVLSASINHYNREFDTHLPNPVEGRLLKEPEGRVRWLTQEEATALIQAAESRQEAPHLAPLIRLALNTGMRAGEMLGLEWNRVDLKACQVYLEAKHTKSQKRRTIPLNQNARAAILTQARYRAEHCPDSPWVFCKSNGTRINSVKRSFTTACTCTEIHNFRFHDLRHTCAAWLVTAGVTLAEIKDLLGHSTIVMTERYAHLAPENIRAAVSLLDQDTSRFGHVDIKVQL